MSINTLKESERQRKNVRNVLAATAVNGDNSFDRKLRNMDNERRHKENRDPVEFENGQKWYESGLAFEDAPDDKKCNMSFMYGFDVAKRRAEGILAAYNSGKEWFEKGKKLEDVKGIYNGNEDFINGYNDAKNKSHTR